MDRLSRGRIDAKAVYIYEVANASPATVRRRADSLDINFRLHLKKTIWMVTFAPSLTPVAFDAETLRGIQKVPADASLA